MIDLRTVLTGVAVAAAIAVPGTASAQEKSSGSPNDGGPSVTVGGSVHVLLSTTSVEGAAEPTLWEFRKVRLDVRAKLNGMIGARFQPEFSGSRVSIKNAYISLKPSGALEFRVGQERKPFGLKTSSTTRLFVERDARIRGLAQTPYAHDNIYDAFGYVDREVGIQVHGKPAGAPLGLAYSIGVFNGPVNGVVAGENTFQFSGRATVEPYPKLRLGVSGSRRDFAPAPGDASTELRGGNAWAVDMEYGDYAPGIHLAAEYASGAADPFSGTGRDFQAFGAWAGYRTEKVGSLGMNIEPVLRVSYGKLDADDATIAAGGAGGMLLTPGINFYFTPLSRIMINYDIWNPRGESDSVSSLKVKFQVEF